MHRMSGRQAEQAAQKAHRKATMRKAKQGNQAAVNRLQENPEQPRNNTKKKARRWPF